MTKTDQSFDGIAHKFDANIYGTSKGRLRHTLLMDNLQPYLTQREHLKVIDIGGGTGEMTLEALRCGHSVVLNDLSADVLAIAKQKLAPFVDQSSQRLELLHADLQDIPHDAFDIVMCHAVLEWTAEPLRVVERLVSLLSSDGLLSLSFFNYHAALFGNALYGNFDFIQRGMPSRNTVRLNPHNPQKPEVILAALEQMGLQVEVSAGIRCFHDYLRDREHQDTKYDDLLALERELSDQVPYKWLGRYFHIIAKQQ